MLCLELQCATCRAGRYVHTGYNRMSQWMEDSGGGHCRFFFFAPQCPTSQASTDRCYIGPETVEDFPLP